MTHNKTQSDVVVLRSLRMRYLTHFPMTVAIDEKGGILIDVRLSSIDPDKLIDRLNADRIELYRRHDCALVPIKWVKFVLADDSLSVSAVKAVEQAVEKCFQSFPGSYLSYRPVTEVGMHHG